MRSNSKKLRVLFIYEWLYPPFDEGMKNTANRIFTLLKENHDAKLIRDVSFFSAGLNSLFVTPRIILSALLHRPDRVIYIPKSSLTLVTFIKVFMLGLILGKRLTVVGLQDREITPAIIAFATRIKNVKIYVLSKKTKHELTSHGIDVKVLPIGVDHEQFYPVDDKKGLRERFGLSTDKKVVLHVGHIRKSRNLDWLLKLAEDDSDFQIVCVGSTSTEGDKDLRKSLEQAGIMVITEHLKDIEAIYQAADIYCFPVLEAEAAMEMPLSVLEAMCVNLPIVTTPFGRLPEIIPERTFVRYVSDCLQFQKALTTGFPDGCDNREFAKKFSWDLVVDELLGT